MDMKKHLKKGRFAGLAALALATAWAVTLVSPPDLPAQDIDDVIQQLDQDFSVGSNKEELKRSNIETANEQNREDIKILESEGQVSGGSIIISYNAVIDPSDFTINSVSALGQTFPVNEMVSVTGMGNVTTTIPVTASIPSGQSVSVSINLTCDTSPNCHAQAGISGVISCPTMGTGVMVYGETKTLTTTCST